MKMKHTLIPITCFFGLLFLLIQCTRNDGNPVGSRYFQRDNTGSELYLVIETAPSDTFYNVPVSGGKGVNLYVGEYMGNRATSFLYFSSLPDSGTVDSAFVTLGIRRTFGEVPYGFIPSVHIITESWSDTSITWEEAINTGFLRQEIDVREVYNQNDSLVFSLPTSLVQSWIDTLTSDQNHGIALSTSFLDTDFMLELVSTDEALTTTNRPHLTLYMTQDTTEELVDRYAVRDAFVAKTTQEPTSDRLFVSNGTALRSLLYFNIDSIPDNATINAAFLALYSDTLLAFPDRSDPFDILADRVSDSTWPIPLVPYESSFGMSGYLTGDSTLINLSVFVQSWTSETVDNMGILLLGMNEKRDIIGRAFYSSSSDPALRPKLKVFYSLPPASRL
jgi:hypothetical protein